MKFDELNIDERILRAIEDRDLRKLHLYRHRQFQLYVKVLMLSDRHRQVLVRQQHTQFLCL